MQGFNNGDCYYVVFCVSNGVPRGSHEFKDRLTDPNQLEPTRDGQLFSHMHSRVSEPGTRAYSEGPELTATRLVVGTGLLFQRAAARGGDASVPRQIGGLSRLKARVIKGPRTKGSSGHPWMANGPGLTTGGGHPGRTASIWASQSLNRSFEG